MIVSFCTGPTAPHRHTPRLPSRACSRPCAVLGCCSSCKHCSTAVSTSHIAFCCIRALLRRAMAELLMAAVSRGVWAAAAREHSARQQQRGGGRGRLVTAALARIPRQLPPLPPLPPPMVTDNYEANATSCHMQVRSWSALGVLGSGARRRRWQPTSVNLGLD